MPEVVGVLRIADLERFRLFLWELRELADRMQIEACPHGDFLAHLVERFAAGEEGDRPDRENTYGQGGAEGIE